MLRPTRAPGAIGRLYRACAAILAGSVPDEVRDAWWLGRAGSQRYDQREAAREVWEALAARGQIPFDWCDDPRRAFERALRGGVPCPTCDGEGCAECAGSWPWTLRDCVLFASDPRGMLTAEALVREGLVRQFAAGRYHGKAPERVRWRALDALAAERHRVDVIQTLEHSAPDPDSFALELARTGYGVQSVGISTIGFVAAEV